jgi:hypothetical protein
MLESSNHSVNLLSGVLARVKANVKGLLEVLVDAGGHCDAIVGGQMSPIVVGKGGGGQGVKLLLNGGINLKSKVANGHSVLLEPFIACLLVCDCTSCIKCFCRCSGGTCGVGPKTQRHKEGPHRTRPDSIVGTVKDGDKLRNIVRQSDL